MIQIQLLAFTKQEPLNLVCEVKSIVNRFQININNIIINILFHSVSEVYVFYLSKKERIFVYAKKKDFKYTYGSHNQKWMEFKLSMTIFLILSVRNCSNNNKNNPHWPKWVKYLL